ncbi:MAG: GntR family transcriptional regulator [Aestuariivirga sp.]
MPSAVLDHLRKSLNAEEGSSSVLHIQIQSSIRNAVEELVMQPGTALPSEREMSEALGVSRTSIRKAMDRLVDEGLLIRRQGARTEIARRFEKPLSSLTSFSEDMRSRGLSPGMIWIARETAAASPSEVMALSLSIGATVSRLKRVRTGDGLPMAIEHATIPSQFLPDPSIVTGSLYDVMSESGHRPARALQRLRAAVASEEDAKLLDLEPGAALLLAERRCFDANGTPVEFTQTRYCGERYDFVVELKPN